jgi:hypothetical protein
MTNKPFPFITKNSSLSGFKTVGTDSYSDFSYGDVLSGSVYPYSASISSDYILAGTNNRRIISLKNTLNYYSPLSQHYSFSSNFGNKAEQDLRLISIPSLFYGSSINKGSVICKWYLTGTLIAELADVKKNGELIQIGPSGSVGSGSVAGVVLYNEGFILLTGSWSLHPTYTDLFDTDLTYYSPAWKYFLNTGSSTINTTPSSSFELDFEGVNYIQTLTMFATAERGEFNHSNNPTYLSYTSSSLQPLTGANFFIENEQKQIKNITKTNYSDIDPKLEKTTYISQIGIYDENRNLLAIAKLATPVRKRQTDNYLFKVKLDI